MSMGWKVWRSSGPDMDSASPSDEFVLGALALGELGHRLA